MPTAKTTFMEFELKHNNGIKLPHLSPSTVSTFIEDRYGFYQSKVMMAPFKGNEYTARGQAVEHAVNRWIERQDPEWREPVLGGEEGEFTDVPPSFLEVCHHKFDEVIKEAGLMDWEVEETRASLQGLLDVALGFYINEFTDRPSKTQQKTVCRLDGVEREILGYTDFLQLDYIRDCKVVSKTPSVLSQRYIIQGSFYRRVYKRQMIFDFFVDNKKPVMKSIALTDDQYIHGISYLTAACKCLEQIQVCEDPKEMMRLMSFPDLSAIYSKSERAAAAKEWGIIL